ncbi:MAG: ABC transporter ATP-binding protein [[Eubacterium] siraeum]|nr:ABC transporter ATP-binding protein [[Eubacterium] siraeum]
MIRTENLTKIYSPCTNHQVIALEGVSLEVGDGEFVAVVGASGSGKTTLMNIIGCLDTPTEGRYCLEGRDVCGLSSAELSQIRSRRISFIFQGFNLIPTLTAAENVELPLIYRKTPAPQRKEAVKEALEAVGLSERAGHLPWELSGGQQQRVAIARAFAANAPLILADEPCGNLDSKAGASVMEMLHKMNKMGKTVVLITHDERAAKTAHKEIRICDGRVCR